jgi:hypothetical protein
MKSAKRTPRRVATVLALLAVMAARSFSGDLIGGGMDPRLKGDPDGVGSLPKAVAPGSTTGPTNPLKTPTLGIILDATTHQPIADALLVVTTSEGEIAGLAITDDDGVFVVYLVDLPDLELSIPSEGVAGVSIEAGDILTIFVP